MESNEKTQRAVFLLSFAFVIVFTIILMLNPSALTDFKLSENQVGTGSRRIPFLLCYFLSLVVMIYSCRNLRSKRKSEKRRNSDTDCQQ